MVTTCDCCRPDSWLGGRSSRSVHRLASGYHTAASAASPALYLDAVAVEDPVSSAVASLCGRNHGYAHWTLVRRSLAALVDCFASARGLLGDGTIILIPSQHVDGAARADTYRIGEAVSQHRVHYDAMWEQLCANAGQEISAIYERYGGKAALSENHLSDVGWSDRGLYPLEMYSSRYPPDETESLLSVHRTGLSLRGMRTLNAAGVASAHLIPASIYGEATHRAIISSMLHPQARPSSVTSTVVATLASAELPLLADLPVKTLLSIRRDESAFAAWRAELRNATRLISEAPIEYGFSAAASESLRDMLMPTVREIERVTTVRRRTVGGARDATIAFGIGAASAIAHGATGIAGGLAGAGAASAAGLASRVLFPNRQPGANAVVMRLLPFLGTPGGRPVSRGR